MKLEDKNVLVISPQYWSDFYVSKNYYALELLKKNCKVYFLQPPKTSNSKGIKVSNDIFNSLYLIEYELGFPAFIRFHFIFLYRWLIRSRIVDILKTIDEKIDVVWCFEPNLYSNLKWFNADFNIYHPVDFIEEKHQIGVAKNADIIFSVADIILDQFNQYTVPRFFINHGLSDYYKHNEWADFRSKEVKVAYVGSLFIPGLDRKSLKEIIINHENVRFDFFGRFSDKPNATEEVLSFIEFLKSRPNVELKGVLHPSKLSKSLNPYGVMLLCYDPSSELNSGSNSHKFLEYLMTGKAIVSSKMELYESLKKDLKITMSNREDNSDFPRLFDQVITDVERLNDPELAKKRREYALQYTYDKQFDKIQKLIYENC